MKNLFRLLGVVVIASFLITACSPKKAPADAPVRVGSTTDKEDLVIAEMYADMLEANDIPVDRKLNIAGGQASNALTLGEIDLYPEYTGTAYQTIMNMNDGERDPKMILDKIDKYYKRRWNITWLTPAPMARSTAIAVMPQVAQQYNLKTITDLVGVASQVRFAAQPDFAPNSDGLAQMQKRYGMFNFKSMDVFDTNLKYQAVQNGQGDALLVNTSDGQIKELRLVVLKDDRGLWPPSSVAPAVRSDVLAKYPQMTDILNQISALLTDDAIAKLDEQVNTQNLDYTQVARNFLKDHGLIQ